MLSRDEESTALRHMRAEGAEEQQEVSRFGECLASSRVPANRRGVEPWSG